MNTVTRFIAHQDYGQKLGYGVVEDNHVVPIFYGKNGTKRFLRLEEGYYTFNPLTETVGPPIPIKLLSQECQVNNVRTKDHIPVNWSCKTQAFLDPRQASSDKLSRIARFTPSEWNVLISTGFNSALRDEVSQYCAEQLDNFEVRQSLKSNICQRLKTAWKPLGLNVEENHIIFMELTFSKEFQYVFQKGYMVEKAKSLLKEDGQLSQADITLLVNFLTSVENTQGTVSSHLYQTTEKVFDVHHLRQLLSLPMFNSTNQQPNNMSKGGENISTSVSAD